MKAGYTITRSELNPISANYIEVCNFHAINEVGLFFFNSNYERKKSKFSVGKWKIKK